MKVKFFSSHQHVHNALVQPVSWNVHSFQMLSCKFSDSVHVGFCIFNRLPVSLKNMCCTYVLKVLILPYREATVVVVVAVVVFLVVVVVVVVVTVVVVVVVVVAVVF